MAGLSQKAIRAIVQEAGTCSKKQLVDALGEQDIDFNAPLLDGFIEQAKTKGWLEVDDKGKMNIKKRVGGGGGGTPTILYRATQNEKGKVTVAEQPYDAKAEAKDAMLKRTPSAAIKVAKADWYTNHMVVQREGWREAAAKVAPKRENPKDKAA